MLGRKADVVFLVVLQLILGVFYIEAIPRVYLDEVWDTSLGYNLASTGSLSHPFVEGFGGMEVHFVQSRVILPLVCAAVFSVTDYSIAAGRICSLLFGALGVVSLHAVMRRWFGRKQAFFIALAAIIHPWFFEASRRARPEIYYIGLSLAFLWMITIFFDSGSRRAAFFAGVFAALSGLTHPTGLVLVSVIGCAVVVWQESKLLGRLIVWASLGFVIVVLPYVVYVLWAVQNPQVNFAEQMQLNQLHRAFLSGEISRWRKFLQWPKGVPLAVIMFGSWIAAWYRSSAADKTIASIVVLFVLLLPFTTVNATARYLIAISPFLSALTIRLIWRLIADGKAIWKRWYKARLAVGSAVLVLYLSTCIVAIGMLFYYLRGANFTKVVNRVASVVGPESRVYGDPIFWIGHSRYKYGPSLITDGPILLREGILWGRKHRFDYAIKTAWVFNTSWGIDEPPKSMPVLRDGYMLDYFCILFGTKVDEFRDPYFGPIEIYKLDWSHRHWERYDRIQKEKRR